MVLSSNEFNLFKYFRGDSINNDTTGASMCKSVTTLVGKKTKVDGMGALRSNQKNDLR